MRTLITYIADTLFPPSVETLLVRRLTHEDVKKLYTPQSLGYGMSVSSFSSPTIRSLVHEAKFKNNTRAQELLSLLLLTHLELHTHLRSSLFVPVPLSKIRQRERGYNQVTRILEALHLELPGITIDETVLRRARHTRPQTELKKQERLTNMDGAFVCNHPEAVRGKHIVLIDDVSTTGATLQAGENALIPHRPASVTLIAIAH